MKKAESQMGEVRLLTNLRQKIAYSKMHKKQKAMFALAMQG